MNILDTVQDGEVFENISVTAEPGVDKDELAKAVQRAVDKVKIRFQDKLMTPENMRDLQTAIGDAARNVPGVQDVRVTPPITSNQPTIMQTVKINLNEGTLSIVDTEILEGKPVPMPPWASRDRGEETDRS